VFKSGKSPPTIVRRILTPGVVVVGAAVDEAEPAASRRPP